MVDDQSLHVNIEVASMRRRLGSRGEAGGRPMWKIAQAGAAIDFVNLQRAYARAIALSRVAVASTIVYARFSIIPKIDWSFIAQRLIFSETLENMRVSFLVHDHLYRFHRGEVLYLHT